MMNAIAPADLSTNNIYTEDILFQLRSVDDESMYVCTMFAYSVTQMSASSVTSVNAFFNAYYQAIRDDPCSYWMLAGLNPLPHPPTGHIGIDEYNQLHV